MIAFLVAAAILLTIGYGLNRLGGGAKILGWYLQAVGALAILIFLMYQFAMGFL